MSARIREAQSQLNLAAYDAEEAGRTLRRIDAVMDAGGWGYVEKADAQQVLKRLANAQERVQHALTTMASSVPLGVQS